jgi:2-polyprenyl-3-methyl-5-hydroxy-6-metoxy-1,4-benzoquinol methylase
MRVFASRSWGAGFKPPLPKGPTPNSKTFSTQFDERGAPSNEVRKSAAHWRWDMRPVPPPIDRKTLESLLKAIEDGVEISMLEIGPGDGHVLSFLKPLTQKGANVLVMDQNKEVISDLRDEFGGNLFDFKEGERPSHATKERQDYVRATRVVPHLDDAELEHFFTDVGFLLKHDGSLFVTAYHKSQTPVHGFGTQSLEQILEIAGKGLLKPDQFEVAFVRPGRSHEPLETLSFDVADVTPEVLKEHDKEIAGRRAELGGDIEVEMRLRFVRADAKPSIRHRLPEE